MSPSVKLPLVCICILICLVFNSYALCAFLFLTSVLSVHFLGRTKMRDIARLMSIPSAFVITGCIAILLAFGRDNSSMLLSMKIGGVYIGIGRGSVGVCIKTAAKAFACVSCMYFLSLTTPMNDLFGVLRRSFIPDCFVEIAELIYRYIFVLYDAAARIELAQKTRLGYVNLRTSYKSVASLITSVLVRAYKQADRTYTALEARGYTGSLETVNKRDRVKPRHALTAAVYIVCALVIGIMVK